VQHTPSDGNARSTNRELMRMRSRIRLVRTRFELEAIRRATRLAPYDHQGCRRIPLSRRSQLTTPYIPDRQRAVFGGVRHKLLETIAALGCRGGECDVRAPVVVFASVA